MTFMLQETKLDEIQLHRRLNDLAAKNGTTLTALLKQAIIDLLEDYGG